MAIEQNRPMTETIMAQIQKEVELLLSQTTPGQDSLDQNEELARAFALRCGAIAFEKILDENLQAHNRGYAGEVIADEDGKAFFERYEERWILSHLGRFRISRAYYWNRDKKGGCIPLDRKWDLDSREPTPSLRESIGMLSAEIPFARSRRILKKTSLLELPEKRIQESGEALGGIIKEKRQQLANEAAHTLQDAHAQLPTALPSAREGTLYVLLDGGRINTTTSGWREPKVSTLFWGDDVVEESKDRRTILHKEYIATLGDADHISTLLWETACRWEWWKAERIVVLGDGAPWIWNRAQDLFPDAVQILDLYHAKEHIWKVARALYGGRGKQKDKGAGKKTAKDRRTEDWAKERCFELEHDQFDSVIEKLERCRPKDDETQKVVDELIKYLKDNRCRMDYAKYRSLGLSVGSGAIESGVKNVVNQRMKGCGMRWAEEKAENMLNLRAAHLSDIGPYAKLDKAAA